MKKINYRTDKENNINFWQDFPIREDLPQIELEDPISIVLGCDKIIDGVFVKGDREAFKATQALSKTAAATRQNRMSFIEKRLVELDRDVSQCERFGLDVPNIEGRKQEFIQLHGELRTLQGKEPRR